MHICLFDIDGTLLDTGGAGQRSILHMLEEEFQVSAPVEGIPTAGRTDHSIMVDLFKYFGISPIPVRIGNDLKSAISSCLQKN